MLRSWLASGRDKDPGCLPGYPLGATGAWQLKVGPLPGRDGWVLGRKFADQARQGIGTWVGRASVEPSRLGGLLATAKAVCWKRKPHCLGPRGSGWEHRLSRTEL